jgi:DNA processing protein
MVSSSLIRELATKEFPPLLAHIPQPPAHLWLRGELPAPDLTLLAVVGSRKYTTYGKQAVESLIGGLAGYPIGIVSGLALGIDALAHEAALRAGLYTLAVPGSGLGDQVLYPASNRRLADRIVDGGGGLLSELSPDTRAALWTFPQRNRLMAGMCAATLLIEAGEKSGTLITARMAVDYNRELLVVPGSIFSPTSRGCHQFLKLGATPVTDSHDILAALGIDEVTTKSEKLVSVLSPEATLVLSHLTEPTDRDTLIRQLGLPTAAASIILMQAELEGHIAVDGGIYTPITNLNESNRDQTLFPMIY